MRLICSLIVVVACLLATFSAQAKVYDSFNGRFYFELPDHWTQIDYITAQYYIQQSAGKTDFEAVFATTDANPWFEGPYLIITIDTVGELTDEEMNDVLENMEDSFERSRIDMTVEDFLTAPQSEIIAFDQEAGASMALTQVGENSDVSRINLLVARYYNRGVANFFFYAPDSLFATSLPDIKQIVTSFTVGSPPAAETKPVKVAEDLEKRQKGNGSNQTVLFGGLGAVLVILIIVLAARKKRAA